MGASGDIIKPSVNLAENYDLIIFLIIQTKAKDIEWLKCIKQFRFYKSSLSLSSPHQPGVCAVGKYFRFPKGNSHEDTIINSRSVQLSI